jgi:hypothetical protein
VFWKKTKSDDENKPWDERRPAPDDSTAYRRCQTDRPVRSRYSRASWEYCTNCHLWFEIFDQAKRWALVARYARRITFATLKCVRRTGPCSARRSSNRCHRDASSHTNSLLDFHCYRDNSKRCSEQPKRVAEKRSTFFAWTTSIELFFLKRFEIILTST